MAAPDLHSQCFQGAELELLNRPSTASEFLRNFANTAVIDEAASDDIALIFRQALDQLRKYRLPFRLLRNTD
jgi:hypothetical protein